MRRIFVLLSVVACSLFALAQQAQVQPAVVQQTSQPKACLTVVDVGSHAFRNIMLGGIAGAVVSKTQYKVVDSVNYPAHEGQKFHGNDLQTIEAGGVHVTVLDKKYTPSDVATARNFCSPQK
jgi:hypothetical protein